MNKKLILSLGIATALMTCSGILFPKLIGATTQPTNPEANSQQLATPLYKANSNADRTKFITKEKAVEQAHIKQDGKLISVDLVTWDQFSREVLDKPNSFNQVENERMVWVVKVDYPNGIDTRGGYFYKATQISAFDAETGQLLNVTTMGDSPSKDHKKK